MTWSGLAKDVAISKLTGAELLVGPGWFSIVGDGERKRVRGFLATLLGEALPKSLTADSEDFESLAGFLLLMNLKTADIVEELLKILHQITEYRYCGLGTGGGWNDEAVMKCNAGKR
jgi:hypothetical protein